MKKKIAFNIVFTILILIILFFLQPTFYGEIDDTLNFFTIILSISNCFFFLSNFKNFLQSWINFNTFFISGYFIVHFQIILLNSLGISPSDPAFIWINRSVVNYANWISCLTISFYILFSLIYLYQTDIKNVKINFHDQLINTKKIDFFIYVLFASFIALVGASFLSGVYDGGKSWGAGASYVFIALKACLLIRLIYFFVNYSFLNKTKKLGFFRFLFKNKIILIVLGFFILLFISSGDRGPIIEFGLILLFLFSMFVKRIKGSQVLLLIFIGAVLMTALREGRAIKDSKEFILNRGIENIGNRNSFGFTEELASSVRILFKGVNLFPNSQDYLYGQTMIVDLSASIPLLSGLIIDTFNIPKMYTSSTAFFTIHGQGQFYSYGEGSDIIADIYINFGILGVIIFFSFFGYFISKISTTVHTTNRFMSLIILVVYCSCSIYLNRSVFFYPMQMLSLTLLFDYMFRKKLA